MSKVRNLPELLSFSDSDLIYAVESAINPNGGRRATIATLRSAILTAAAVKTIYESNADTNAFTDAEKTKLAGIENGATADQTAAEVPYDNSVSGLSAIQTNAAIDEVNQKAQADFRPSIVSGRILRYTGGTARFDNTFYELVTNDILLNQNITNGEVYVDLDGIVKQTGSGVLSPPYTIVFAKFSTDLNNIISLTDQRVKNSQNIVRGLLSDVRWINAGTAADEGNSGRVSDAMHKHNILTGAPSTQIPDQANAEGVSGNLARADHTHQLVTAAPITSLAPSVSNAQGSATSFSRSDHTHSIATALTADITTIQPNATTDAGTADNFARGDHRHAIATAAATTQIPDQTNAEGVSTNFARADHTHELVTAAPITALSPAVSDAQGSATSFSRSDHTHSIATALTADITTIQPDATADAGVSNTFARGDHRHAIAAAAAATQTPDQANAEGASTSFARADHTHQLVTAAPVTALSPAVSNAQGSASSFSRSDHTHSIATALVSDITTIQPNATAAAGTANTFARGDHRHAIVTAAPVTTLSPATTNAEGSGTSFARNDHTHAIGTGLVGDITTIQPDAAADAGTADRFARADHRHAIVAAAPVDTGTANSEGASTSFARADHVHNTIIANSVASATADDTTASLTDVLIVGMTLTPAAGTYLAIFSSSVLNSGNGATRLFVSIYSAGTQVAHSEREIGIAGGANVPVHTSAVITVNGSQAIEARWRAVAGTNTAHERSLTLIRLG